MCLITPDCEILVGRERIPFYSQWGVKYSQSSPWRAFILSMYKYTLSIVHVHINVKKRYMWLLYMYIYGCSPTPRSRSKCFQIPPAPSQTVPTVLTSRKHSKYLCVQVSNAGWKYFLSKLDDALYSMNAAEPGTLLTAWGRLLVLNGLNGVSLELYFRGSALGWI